MYATIISHTDNFNKEIHVFINNLKKVSSIILEENNQN